MFGEKVVVDDVDDDPGIAALFFREEGFARAPHGMGICKGVNLPVEDDSLPNRFGKASGRKKAAGEIAQDPTEDKTGVVAGKVEVGEEVQRDTA